MINRLFTQSNYQFVRRTCAAIVVTSLCLVSQPVQAQFGFGLNNRTGVVGGVSIDAEGVVQAASVEQRGGILQQLRKTVGVPTDGMEAKTELRMISLTKLQAEIQKAMTAGQPLPDEVLYLAGLQRVQYVFVYPEQQDIVLAGPAEGWVVRQDATVVGATTGRPVLQLEDLLVALRTTEASRQHPISVSIEPTAEGQQRLTALLRQVRPGPGFNPAAIEPAMREAFGPQQVKLTTVASNSRMAQTLVAADYEMKRLAMNLEPAPVTGMPSYMTMIRNTGKPEGNQPRWWMACDYDAIAHSEDMLAWKISGLGIKAMTEDEYVDTLGNRTGTGKANKVAQRWADLFTAKFEELCGFNAAFGDLRNVMDLNIVATVIAGHQLEQLAGCDLSLLVGSDNSLETPQWHTPKTISPECSFVRGQAGWTVSASGGVDINPWKIVSQKSAASDAVKSVRTQAEATDNSKWWWN
ncbi:DUF1598 domain-containing protein [Aureliella helgolandensis]|uniref:DUF1598 domain-containing protein n=1 Tax=Aureliella helgolandensis TaxID=2527968 RepID=A0A518GBY9_9BACT|nr:DUF1598 domain-containing protein [Aureliella helgolandensis]QDV26109.1 hypothetical protein Q31a_44810 [Aureliella helgolandensis]